MAKKSTQSCDAWLTIGGITYPGSTGRDHGHAEMDALDGFIMSDPGSRGSVKGSVTYCAGRLKDSSVGKTVYCPSRPCCVKCSAVLKKLGFQLGKDTTWGEDSMGSTEWGVSLNVRSLLAECGVDYEDIKKLG